MLLPGRHGTDQNAEDYRYSFQGMEADDEIKGTKNSYDFGARILDPRIGRWLSGDPADDLFPGESIYLFAGNNPIYYVDPNGKWKVRWRDNNDHSAGIVFEAEKGDNLETLATQMGIPYKELIDENFNGHDFTLNSPLEGGEWIRQEDLPGVEAFQQINIYLKKEDVEETNCSNCAMFVNGINQHNAWDEEDPNWSIAVMMEAEKMMEESFVNVSEKDAKIGDINTHMLRPENNGEVTDYAGWYFKGKRFTEDGTGYSPEFIEYVYSLARELSPGHYSVVLLKSKDGDSILKYFEKPGSGEPRIRDVSDTDSYLTNPIDSSDKSATYTKKNNDE